MFSQSPSSNKKGDLKKIHTARKQIIQCESIIRKVLAIYNCLDKLEQFEHTEDNQVQLLPRNTHPAKTQSNPVNLFPKEVSCNNIFQDTQINTVNENSYKPASSHISTPLFNRSSTRHTVPMVSNPKPVSQHISTPIPSHTPLSTSNLVFQNSTESECAQYSPTFSRHDIRNEFSETSFHTPTKRRKLNTSMSFYGMSMTDEKHIHWVDKESQRPLVQKTPPPSKPLHRQHHVLKSVMESPDAFTKQRLANQRLAMLQRKSVQQKDIERKKAHLF